MTMPAPRPKPGLIKTKYPRLAAATGAQELPDNLPDSIEAMHVLFVNEGYTQYRIGSLYNHILDNRMAEKAGYRFARDLFAKEFKDIAQSTLSAYGAVANAFSEEIASKYCITVLGQLIAYCKAKKMSLSDDDPAELLITVPEKNGTTVEKRFADCTRSDLNKATKLLVDRAGGIPPKDSRKMERLHDALRVGLGHASKVELKASYKENQGTTVSLLNVGIEELQEVLTVLLNAPQDADAPATGQPLRVQPRTTKRR